MSSIKYNPTPEDLAKLEEWLDERPAIRSLVAKVSPWHCYRLKNTRGHYAIYSYGEGGTVTLSHGADSTLPGVGVFGIDPDEMVICDCGSFEHPNAAQRLLGRALLEANRSTDGGDVS